MRKLIQALVLTLALTAPIYAGEMGQPIAPPSNTTGEMGQPIAVSGDIQNGIAQATLTVLEVLLAVV